MDSSDKVLVWCVGIICSSVVFLLIALIIQDTVVDLEAIKAGMHQQVIGSSKIWVK